MSTTIPDLINAIAASLSQPELSRYMALWSSVVHYRITPELTFTNTADLEAFMRENFFPEGGVPGEFTVENITILAEVDDAAIFGFDLLAQGNIIGTYKLGKAIKIEGEWKLVSLNFYFAAA